MIPENFEEFLYWVKERTEAYWSKKIDYYEVVPFNESFLNAKWVGLKDEQINEIELKYDIKFNSNHKSFLKILHTLDRKISCGSRQSSELFDNWLNYSNNFIAYLEYPINSLTESLLSKDDYWIGVWGEKPKNKNEQKNVIKSRFDDSPKLINLNKGVFVLDGKDYISQQVLSIYGEDVLLYKNLKQYIIDYLSHHLGLDELEFDKELNKWVTYTKTDYYDYENHEIEIPFWKDIIGEYDRRFYANFNKSF